MAARTDLMDIHNMLVEHRNNVYRLISIETMVVRKKLKLHAYAQSLTRRIDTISGRILIEFIIEEDDTIDQPTYNTYRSDQEPDCLTVGNFKHSKSA